jgi:hypothetical protein
MRTLLFAFGGLSILTGGDIIAHPSGSVNVWTALDGIVGLHELAPSKNA